MSCSAYCTLNGQPIPDGYGYEVEDKIPPEYEDEFYFAQLHDYEREIRSRFAVEGEKACEFCIYSDLYKDVYGCRPHFCPCKR